tara:strand:- start:2124 stop:2795 length:672 start_codon:yes stop_codon:yes gene_type:complete
MQFINNWIEPVVLAQGAESLVLGLPDGQYVLTIADSATAPTRWEIVAAIVTGGTASLQRGQEGTSDQLWPVGSVIYCTLTGATLQAILSRLDALELGGVIVIQITSEAVSGMPTDMAGTGYQEVGGIGVLISAPSSIGGIPIAVQGVTSTENTMGETPLYGISIYGTTTGALPSAAFLLSAPGYTDVPVTLEQDGSDWFLEAFDLPAGQLWADGPITVTITPA